MQQAYQGRMQSGVLAAIFTMILSVGAAQAQDAAPSPELVAKGEALFNGKQMGACWACHGDKGKGTANAPKLADDKWLDTDGSLQGIKDVITNGVPKPKKHSGAMPPLGGGKYSGEEVDALAAYVYSLSHKDKK